MTSHGTNRLQGAFSTPKRYEDMCCLKIAAQAD